MDDDKYHITENDINKMVEYLKISNAKSATPEIAYKVLERLYANQQKLEQLDPNAIEEILKDLEEY